MVDAFGFAAGFAGAGFALVALGFAVVALGFAVVAFGLAVADFDVVVFASAVDVAVPACAVAGFLVAAFAVAAFEAAAARFARRVGPFGSGATVAVGTVVGLGSGSLAPRIESIWTSVSQLR